jgi:Cu-processing system permease protein
MLSFSGVSIGLVLALRARYLWLSGLSLFVLVLAVLLAAQFSGRQPATVALDVGLSVMRVTLPVVSILMAQALISHEFERRYFLSFLPYPRPRFRFLLERFIAIIILVVSLLIAMSLMLAVLTKAVASYEQATPVDLAWRYSIVVAFLGVDLILLSAFSVLLSVVASTASFVLIGTIGFMVLARSYAAVIDLLSRNGSLVGDAESYSAGVSLLFYVFPNLGALDVRSIALYSTMKFFPADWMWLILSCLSYLIAVLALSVWMLQCKRLA